MGSKKLPNQLTDDEKKVLKEKIKEHTAEIKAKIDEKYPDDYQATTLMDEGLTKEKNAILRRIKFHQAKELSLKNFIRRTRE